MDDKPLLSKEAAKKLLAEAARARAAAYGVDPQIGVALDVTLSGDTPKGTKIAVKAGEGPCVKVRDSSLVCSPRVVDCRRNMA